MEGGQRECVPFGILSAPEATETGGFHDIPRHCKGEIVEQEMSLGWILQTMPLAKNLLSLR
jgi:hypothetical protein